MKTKLPGISSLEFSCQGPGQRIEDAGCLNCQVRKLFLFSELTPEELAILNQGRSSLHYKGGETIYRQDSKSSGLLCLSSGKVKIEKDNLNGGIQIIELKKESEFIGFADLMNQSVHSASAVALEECKVCQIPQDNFLKVLKSNNTLAIKTIEYLASELVKSNDRAAHLTQKHMRARLADAILYTHQKFQTTSQDLKLHVRLKRSDLAALSNMTTANAIRTLTDFSKDEIIEVKGRSLTIKNLSALRKISLLG